MILLNPDDVKWIVLHTTDSPYGDVDTITDWHKQRNFATIGYHYLITNTYPTYSTWKQHMPDLAYDGVVHKGRSEQFRGAHVRGHNWETIGVALVGKGGNFSSEQLKSAVKLCTNLAARFPRVKGVKGHYEFNPNKTCPDLDMDYFREFILPLGAELDEEANPVLDASQLGRL